VDLGPPAVESCCTADTYGLYCFVTNKGVDTHVSCVGGEGELTNGSLDELFFLSIGDFGRGGTSDFGAPLNKEKMTGCKEFSAESWTASKKRDCLSSADPSTRGGTLGRKEEVCSRFGFRKGIGLHSGEGWEMVASFISVRGCFWAGLREPEEREMTQGQPRSASCYWKTETRLKTISTSVYGPRSKLRSVTQAIGRTPTNGRREGEGRMYFSRKKTRER